MNKHARSALGHAFGAGLFWWIRRRIRTNQGKGKSRRPNQDLFFGNDSLTSVRTLRKGVKKIFKYKFSGTIFLPPHKPNYSYKATHRHGNLVCLNQSFLY